MTGNYFLTALARWNVYSGRARRAEFWSYTLIAWLIDVFAIFITAMVLNDAIDSENMTFDTDAVTTVGWITLYASIALGIILFIAWLAVTVRRMHDLGRTGWWAIFLFILPIVVWILALVDGQPMTNKYGEDPKGRDVTKEY